MMKNICAPCKILVKSLQEKLSQVKESHIREVEMLKLQLSQESSIYENQKLKLLDETCANTTLKKEMGRLMEQVAVLTTDFNQAKSQVKESHAREVEMLKQQLSQEANIYENQKLELLDQICANTTLKKEMGRLMEQVAKLSTDFNQEKSTVSQNRSRILELEGNLSFAERLILTSQRHPNRALFLSPSKKLDGQPKLKFPLPKLAATESMEYLNFIKKVKKEIEGLNQLGGAVSTNFVAS